MVVLSAISVISTKSLGHITAIGVKRQTKHGWQTGAGKGR
jgi:hypothetical protein